MPDETAVLETPVSAPEQPPAAPAVEEEKEYRYQPKDEKGNNLGAPQVIKYKTPDELADKLAAQNTELIRLNRKLNRDIRLGNIMQDEIPADAPRVQSGQYEFKPTPLSAEERLEVIRDINDPENFDKAASRIVKATIGDPEAVRGVLSRAEQRIAAMNAQAEAEAFRRSNPDYYVCQENFETLANWMIKNDLEPVKANFELAYEKLGPSGANLLAMRPVSSPAAQPAVPVSQPTPTPASPVATSQEAPKPRLASSGLTRSNSSDGGAPAYNPEDSIVYEFQPTAKGRNGKMEPIGPKQVFKGREALERMPAEEYKRRFVADKSFREIVDKLDKQ